MRHLAAGIGSTRELVARIAERLAALPEPAGRLTAASPAPRPSACASSSDQWEPVQFANRDLAILGAACVIGFACR